jgi:hypothetical protein
MINLNTLTYDNFKKPCTTYFSLFIAPSAFDFVNRMLADPLVNTNINYMAYIFATVYWESDGSMLPIVEKRQVKVDTATRKKVKALQDRYWDSGYYGRGYVQLTWKDNYLKMGIALKKYHPNKYKDLDNQWLVKQPELACHPDTAYDIISVGMIGGYFNGLHKGLSEYINNSKVDFVEARRTVNGTDKATDVAKLAIKAKSMLEAL